LKFLYKIYSGYDGFRPEQIPKRLILGKFLDLGWTRYRDAVEIGDEVWVYFHGPGRFQPGIYVRGRVAEKDPHRPRVRLKVREYSDASPLTTEAESERIARVVSVRFLQVFLFPEQWETNQCDWNIGAESCAEWRCSVCATWEAIPVIAAQEVGLPHRIGSSIKEIVPGIWVIPSRCFVYKNARQVKHSSARGSNMFYRFKLGMKNLAYPLALSMYEALRARRLVNFDCIVPIPLSPDKRAAGEIDRTALLADELGEMLNCRVVPLLSLSRPISKHRLRIWSGLTALQFESEYCAALQVQPQATRFKPNSAAGRRVHGRKHPSVRCMGYSREESGMRDLRRKRRSNDLKGCGEGP
jgi:hypothetical protein